MIPYRTIAETRTPDGSHFSLHEHGGEHFLNLNGDPLMSTTATHSERELADRAFPGKSRVGTDPERATKRVLIGGLGLGYSLARVLELFGDTEAGEVVVAELLPEVVTWNREHLAGVNGALLDDPRVEVFEGDVVDCILRAADGKIPRWDAILLDTDNGPTSLVQPHNSRLYGRGGFAAIWHSLAPGGRAAFWAAGEEPGFEKKLRRDGFLTERYAARMHATAKRSIHRIYVGERPVHAVERKPVGGGPRRRGRARPNRS